jgi:hypothetical protein
MWTVREPDTLCIAADMSSVVQACIQPSHTFDGVACCRIQVPLHYMTRFYKVQLSAASSNCDIRRLRHGTSFHTSGMVPPGTRYPPANFAPLNSGSSGHHYPVAEVTSVYKGAPEPVTGARPSGRPATHRVNTKKS